MIGDWASVPSRERAMLRFRKAILVRAWWGRWWELLLVTIALAIWRIAYGCNPGLRDQDFTTNRHDQNAQTMIPNSGYQITFRGHSNHVRRTFKSCYKCLPNELLSFLLATYVMIRRMIMCKVPRWTTMYRFQKLKKTSSAFISKKIPPPDSNAVLRTKGIYLLHICAGTSKNAVANRTKDAACIRIRSEIGAS